MAWDPIHARRKPCRAVIKDIEEESPAWCIGLEPGMALTHVNGVPLRDMIEWQWQADDFEVEITTDEGDVAIMEREFGEDWGITFTDCIFDGIAVCRNNCSFCFMRMLPDNMRPALTLRDDDYRLSFLQGNFVTLTNVAQEDCERIVDQNVSPLHMSLHAISPEVRRELMGRNAQHGIDVAERLLEAGIEMHTQLVVVPGVNDGEELRRTLEWIEEHPGILSCAIVPLGYTRYQDRFAHSFNSDPAAAARLIADVEPYQEKARRETGNTRYQLSDEFYLAAGCNFPPAEHYDGFPQYYDGIGMARVFLDTWDKVKDQLALAATDFERGAVTIVTGEAFGKILAPLAREVFGDEELRVLSVPNRFFGGNVDVAGLLTGADMVDAINEEQPSGVVLIPAITFNASALTLDDMTLADLKSQTGADIRLCGDVVESLLELFGVEADVADAPQDLGHYE